MGVHHLSERFGEFGQFRVELVMNAARKRGESFDESVEMGIGHLGAIRHESAGFGGIALLKRLPIFGQKGQLALEVRFQSRSHASTCRTLCNPVSGSMSVSNETSGAGSSANRASIWQRTAGLLPSSTSLRIT